jgi:GNAT superfamily N-acetyltransferase
MKTTIQQTFEEMSKKDQLLVRFTERLEEVLGITFELKYGPISTGVLYNGHYRMKSELTKVHSVNTSNYRLLFIPGTNECVELYIIEVFKRGNGFGTELMNKILDVCDELGVTLRLVPSDFSSDENSPKNYLQSIRNWYISFGFELSKLSRMGYYYYRPEIQYQMVG